MSVELVTFRYLGSGSASLTGVGGNYTLSLWYRDGLGTWDSEQPGQGSTAWLSPTMRGILASLGFVAGHYSGPFVSCLLRLSRRSFLVFPGIVMNLVTILSVDLDSRGRGATLPAGQQKAHCGLSAGRGRGTHPMRGSGEAIALLNRVLLGLLLEGLTLYNLIHRAPPVTKWTVLPLMILFLNSFNEV